MNMFHIAKKLSSHMKKCSDLVDDGGADDDNNNDDDDGDDDDDDDERPSATYAKVLFGKRKRNAHEHPSEESKLPSVSKTSRILLC